MSVREDILSGLTTAFETARLNSDYAAGVRTVCRYDRNLLASKSWDSPMLMVIDLGRESLVAKGGSYARYRSEIAFRGYVKSATSTDLHTDLNNLLSDIKLFLDTLTVGDIHSNLLSVQYLRSDVHRFDEDGEQGDCVVLANVTYVDSCSPVSVPTVTGQAFIDQASDLIYARFASLSFNRYQRHDSALMRVPSISVGFHHAEASEAGLGTSLGIDYTLYFTVRVHGAFGDGWVDGLTLESMLSTVSNRLYTKVHLDSTYTILNLSDFQSRVHFEESDTIGGEVTVAVNGYLEHTQE